MGRESRELCINKPAHSDWRRMAGRAFYLHIYEHRGPEKMTSAFTAGIQDKGGTLSKPHDPPVGFGPRFVASIFLCILPFNVLLYFNIGLRCKQTTLITTCSYLYNAKKMTLWFKVSEPGNWMAGIREMVTWLSALCSLTGKMCAGRETQTVSSSEWNGQHTLFVHLCSICVWSWKHRCIK